MIEIEPNCYLVDYCEKNKYFVGSMLMGKTIILIEIYFLEGKEYLKIKTQSINFVI